MSSLRDRFKQETSGRGGGAVGRPATAGAAPAAASVDRVDGVDRVDEERDRDVPATVEILERVECIEIEAVVGGALQRIQFIGGTNPAEVREMLLMLDGNAKVRDDFPRKSFGNRDTKCARAMVLTLRITDSGKFIDIVCQNGDDLTVAVSKKSSETWAEELKALGKLHERSMAKVEKAFAENGQATVILGEDEQFGVNYWTTDDGKAFLDSMTAEPPAVKEVDHE